MSSVLPTAKRPPGSLAERFWSIANSSGPHGDDTTAPDAQSVVRHVLKVLDALSAGEVGDGVSRNTISFLHLLRQQEALGDLSYASPEQARGETLDERSLVFSIGVLIFEELTGRHPFGAVDSPRRFARIQKCELGSGVQYFPKVPEELRKVLMRAMGPFPEERFESLRELRSHLERFVNGEFDVTPAPQKVPRRPLKGLSPSHADLAFSSVEEMMPTMVRVRKLTPPLIPKKTIVTPTSTRDTAKVAAMDDDGPGRGRKLIERLVWLGAGAGVSLVAMWMLHVRAMGGQPMLPQAIVAAPRASLAAPAAPPVTQKTLFDPNGAGQDVVAKARSCFEADRLALPITFNVGVLFSKVDGKSHRTFLSPDEELTPEESGCLQHALIGIAAGVTPDKSTVVEYKVRLKPGAHDEFKATIPKD